MIKTKENVRGADGPWGRIFCCSLMVSVLGLTGCASQGKTSGLGDIRTTPQSEVQESYSVHHPAMVFYSDEMLSLLAERREGDDVLVGDWISRRNDHAVGLRPVVWDPFTYSRVVITEDDSLRDNHGRPRTISRRRVRTIRSGRGR